MAISNVPDTAAGVSPARVDSRVFSITRTHGLAPRRIPSISPKGTTLLSLMQSAWLWQRIASMRAQIPSMITGGSAPRILVASTLAFHSSRVWPPSISRSIQGSTLHAKGTPISETGNSLDRWAAVTALSISTAGRPARFSREPLRVRSCPASSCRLRAPAPDTAW